MFVIIKALNGGSLAVRLLLVAAAFALLASLGCAQASSPPERQEKQAGIEEAAPEEEVVGGKGNAEPSTEDLNLTPPQNKTLRLTVPKMERMNNDEIPTGSTTDETLFHDYAGVHIKRTGWPWQKVANVYITGHRLGYRDTNSWLAFWDLNELEEGDEIFITDSEGRIYTYVVYNKFIGEPQRRSDGKHPTHLCGVETLKTLPELRPVEGKNIVTLQACTLPDYTHRLLVRGELKEVSEG